MKKNLLELYPEIIDRIKYISSVKIVYTNLSGEFRHEIQLVNNENFDKDKIISDILNFNNLSKDQINPNLTHFYTLHDAVHFSENNGLKLV